VGHEIIVYRDRQVIIHDDDLETIRNLLLAESDASYCSELKSFIQEWEQVGPGVWIWNDWNAFFAADPARERSFKLLLSRTAQRIEALGSHGVDQPVERLQRKIDELQHLLPAR